MNIYYLFIYMLCLFMLHGKHFFFCKKHENINKQKDLKKNDLINKIKMKTNELRYMFDNLYVQHKNIPLYIFVKDHNEEKRHLLKNIFLYGKLHYLQGLNTPFSKFYMLYKNKKQIPSTIRLQNKIREEKKFIDNMDKSSKKKYIKNKIDKYTNLNINVKKLYSNIEGKINSLENFKDI
ncbi:conserved Plasmodium protein, unknown function [Plasmodium sp. DRC-Itaito]|uniref:Uncharacterized protein n=1 Tax=Plasmodium gaboni TaxID=647221 RepID=A0ABY1UJH0_9APIC|nr:conserved Plasmodium protein, unknown function [Plasmodium gaboni]SOV21554.1 conserved Plasmodium protein, unknown function [Plasmodium sp. DRC-Itaito]